MPLPAALGNLSALVGWQGCSWASHAVSPQQHCPCLLRLAACQCGLADKAASWPALWSVLSSL